MVDIVKSFRRDQQNDNPALVFYALIGNDVCNGHPGTASMTTPEQFEKNVRGHAWYGAIEGVDSEAACRARAARAAERHATCARRCPSRLARLGPAFTLPLPPPPLRIRS